MEQFPTQTPAPNEEIRRLLNESRLTFSIDAEEQVEVLSVGDSAIGTLGNFSASIGTAKSKKTFNVSAIVAAALVNGTVLNYRASFPADKRKILYVGTELNNKAETIMLVYGHKLNHNKMANQVIPYLRDQAWLIQQDGVRSPYKRSFAMSTMEEQELPF